MKDNNYYKKKIEEERAVLISELQRIGIVKDKKNPDDWQATPLDLDVARSDPNEVGDYIESYEGNTALVQELEGRLNELDQALVLMEKGTYGTCTVGGEKIEEDRLDANPAAQTCKKHLDN